MTYIHAELHLVGLSRIYSLAACAFSFRQSIDQRGRPNSKVVGEPLQLLVDGAETSELTEWATMPDSLRSGEIVFFSADATQPRRILKFKDARCVQHHVSLVPGLKVAA